MSIIPPDDSTATRSTAAMPPAKPRHKPSMIRDAIAAAMQRQELTLYRLHKMVEGDITQTTVYRVIADRGETTIANLDLLLKTLGLEVRPRRSPAPRTPSPRRRTRAHQRAGDTARE